MAILRGGGAVAFGHDGLESVTGNGDSQINRSAGPRGTGSAVVDEVAEALHEIVAVAVAEVSWIEANQRPVRGVGGSHVRPSRVAGSCG